MSLVIKELRLFYGPKEILGPLSLDQSAERALAIIGPSASGKTSLAKAILGIGNFKISGLIIFDQQLLQKDSQKLITNNKRKFGYIPETLGCWPHLSVKEAVYLAAKLSSNAQTQIEELIFSCGLSALKDQIPAKLSFGQKARLSIACALAARPKLLILDEALGGLDIVNKITLINLIKEWQKQYKFALIFITHDIAESIQLADDILLLEHGNKLWHGPKEQLLKAPFSKEWNPLLSPLLRPIFN